MDSFKKDIYEKVRGILQERIMNVSLYNLGSAVGLSEFGIKTTDDVIRMLVNLYFESFNFINEGIQEIQMQKLRHELGKNYISACQLIKKSNTSSGEERKKKLEEAESKIRDITNEFREDIKESVERLKIIDGKRGIEWLLRAPSSIRTVDEKCNQIKFCVNYLFEFLVVGWHISFLQGKGNISDELEDFNDFFINEMTNIGGYDLLIAYSKNEDKEYWKRLYQNRDKLALIKEFLQECDNKLLENNL